MAVKIIPLSQAKKIWISKQGLSSQQNLRNINTSIESVIQKINYVQIDTINVIERAHHHILFSRIPGYEPSHLGISQRQKKTIFECWTHALSFKHIGSLPYACIDFLERRKPAQKGWFKDINIKQLKPLFKKIEQNGPLSIRDFESGQKKEKTSLWSSQKKDKILLEYGFHCGIFAIASREGMLKHYDLFERHFGNSAESILLNRFGKTNSLDYEKALECIRCGLNSQGLVSPSSLCHLLPKQKLFVGSILQRMALKDELTEITIDSDSSFQIRNTAKKICIGQEKFYARPQDVESTPIELSSSAHILSPFDPLIIQRERTLGFFELDYFFEAYIPATRRVYGYFVLPVLIGENIVALLDLKADRISKTLLIQSWHWLKGHKNAINKQKIESALTEFSTFQFLSH